MPFQKLAHLLHYFGLPVDEEIVGYTDADQLDYLSLRKTFLQSLDCFLLHRDGYFIHPELHLCLGRFIVILYSRIVVFNLTIRTNCVSVKLQS